ncbi:MAG: VOC family protein [Acidobacteriaceae bacterium]
MVATTSQGWKLQTGHVGLNVTNLERSKKFYQSVFGLKTMLESNKDSQKFVFLGDGKDILVTLFQQSSSRFDVHKPGLHHLSFQLASVEEVKQAEKVLQDMKVKFLYDGIVPHAEGADSGGIFFEDPDGIRLEIYSPTGVKGKPAPVAGAPTCGFF